MKKLFFLAVGSLIVLSCASTKTTISVPAPAGNWDYTISSTPYGDVTGVLTVSQIDKTYTAKMVTSDREIIIDKFIYNEESMKMSGEFDFEGTPVYFDATLNMDQIDGGMSAGGANYPFKATRKN